MKYCTACGSQNFDEAHFCEKCGNVFQFSGIDVGSDTNTYVGKTCPFCQYPIKPGEVVTVCPACGVPHHADCWQSNNNQCTTYGCTGRKQEIEQTQHYNAAPVSPKPKQPKTIKKSKLEIWLGIGIVILSCVLGLFILNPSVFRGTTQAKETSPIKSGGNEIVIGASFELTGGVSNYGKATLSGVKMAVIEVNKAGGINGKKIKLVVSDNKSEPSEAGNAVDKLISQDKAIAIIGPATSVAVAASSQIVTDAKIPLMAPVASAENITVKDSKTKQFIFRACFIDPFQGQIMAEFANKTLNVKNVAILHDASSEYSKGLSTVFQKTLEKNGGKVVANEAFLAKDVDFKSALTKIKATNPEAIYVPAYYEEVAKIIKQAREIGLNCPMLGSDGWDSPKLAEIAGTAALNGTYFCSAYSAQDQEPSVQKFIKNYEAMFNTEPDSFAIHGYDAVMIVIEAIKRAGTTDGVKLAAEIAKTKDLHVATGKVSFDERHNPLKSAIIIEMKDGKQVFKQRINP